MNKFVILLTISVAVSGCAAGSKPPPVSPTTEDIAATYASLETSGIPPGAYVSIGTTLESKACNSWFSSQITGGKETSMAQGVLGLGAAGAAMAGGPASLAAAGGMGLFSSLLGLNQANSPTGSDPIGTYILVNKTLDAWKMAAANPTNIEDAYAFVESYSELCQLPGIQSAMRMALTTAPVMALTPTLPSYSYQGISPSYQGILPSAPVPQRVLPPKVGVGWLPATLTPPSESVGESRVQSRHRQRRTSSLNSSIEVTADYDKAARMQWLRETTSYIPALDGPRH